jgi:hypothetical protein
MAVPASTRIRPSRVHNIDVDRLQRRRDWLIAHKDDIARAADARIELRQLAREIVSINRELVRRRP